MKFKNKRDMWKGKKGCGSRGNRQANFSNINGETLAKLRDLGRATLQSYLVACDFIQCLWPASGLGTRQPQKKLPPNTLLFAYSSYGEIWIAGHIPVAYFQI